MILLKALLLFLIFWPQEYFLTLIDTLATILTLYKRLDLILDPYNKKGVEQQKVHKMQATLSKDTL